MSYPGSASASDAGTAFDQNNATRNKYDVDHLEKPGAVHEKEKITFRVIMLCILASMGVSGKNFE